MAKVDILVVFSGHNNTVAAAVERSQEDLVTSMPGRNKQQRGSKQKKQQPPVPPRPQNSNNSKEKYPTAPVMLARDSAGLCY